MTTNPHGNKIAGGLTPSQHGYSGFPEDEKRGSLPQVEAPAGFKARHAPDQGTVLPFKNHYCPGCEHGIITRMIGRELGRRGILDKSICVVSVGCSVLAYNYLDVDCVQAPHGRSPAIGTGIKRVKPDHNVFMVLGDGDALAIGLSETLQAAHRGENMTVILVNNQIYGMTGGQMAPTTPIGSQSSTSPSGRNLENHGFPVDACALMAQVPGASYVKRVAMAPKPPKKERDPNDPRGLASGYKITPMKKTEKAIKEAFDASEKGGFAFLELLTTCNINWKMKVLESKDHIHNSTVPIFPEGLFVDRLGVAGKRVMDPLPITHPQEVAE